MRKFDAIMIGFGKGGKTLAGALAAKGKHVAVIEQSEKMYGGTCINVGCIPSKSLVTSAKHSSLLGGTFTEKAARYAIAIEEKRRVTALLRNKNYHKLADLKNVEVFTGKASFTGDHIVQVQLKEGGQETLTAEQVFINTGSRPLMPPITGLKESQYTYLSEELLDLQQLPKHLLIIGGGYIGIEFASIFTNFGTQVTVVQDGSVFLLREDVEIAQAVEDVLQKKGVVIKRSTQITEVRDDKDAAVVTMESEQGTETLNVEAILVATGRRANVEGLNLEATGVALTQRGAIQTDEYLRTTAPGIWAMGDVVGGLQFTHISLDDFRIVNSQLSAGEERTTANRKAVPYSVFLDPPFSRVGLSEKEAKEQGYAVKIARLPAAAIPKAQVLKEIEGLEMINLLKLAMDAQISYTILRDNIYTHPTMTEAFNDLLAAI